MLWVATEYGLNRLENGKWFTFFERHGLPANQVNHLVEDDEGHFWCGTETGIFRVSRAELNRVAHQGYGEVSCALYDETDGMPSPETNGQKSSPAGLRTRDGHIWFATARGAVGFNPRALRISEVPPIPWVDRVRARGQSILSELPRESSDPPEVHGHSPDRVLHLAPGSGQSLDFQFGGHYLKAPDRVRFRYRLRGFDTNWVDAGSRRDAFYTNIRPGRYRFEVLAAARHGLWSPEPAGLDLAIQPFLHETFTFRLACGIAAIALIAAVWIWRAAELRRIHRLQAAAALVAEQRRFARDLHDHVGADLTHLTLLADLAKMQAHPMSQEALAKLPLQTRRAMESIRETIWVTLPQNRTLNGLAQRVAMLADELLGVAAITIEHRLPSTAPAAPGTLLSPEVCRGAFLAAKEILHNAVRHSEATNVAIEWASDASEFTLTIEDNGIGGCAETCDPLPAPTRISSLEDGSTNQPTNPHGLGLASIRSRLDALGGRLEIHTVHPHGTSVSIRLPHG